MHCTIPAAGSHAPTIIRPEDVRGLEWRALCPKVECQLIALCSREAPYRIEALALPIGPASLDEFIDRSALPDCSIPDGQRIPVWSGTSERTIWSSPAVNWLFRAWHDSVHLALCRGFDYADEVAVARAQVAMIQGEYERRVLRAETIGQLDYHARWGCFPADQRAFVRAYLADPAVALSADSGVYA